MKCWVVRFMTLGRSTSDWSWILDVDWCTRQTVVFSGDVLWRSPEALLLQSKLLEQFDSVERVGTMFQSGTQIHASHQCMIILHDVNIKQTVS